MGDLDTKAGTQAQELLNKTVPWSETYYDKDDNYIQNLFLEQGEDCNQIFYIEYKYYQIGLTRDWLRYIAGKIGDTITVRREILLQRLHGSSLSPFPQEDILYIYEVQKVPIDELFIMQYYRFDIYKKLDPKIPYIIGVDCSTGTNGDNNAITILNPYTLEPDAEFECSYIGETKFEQLLTTLVKEVLPRGVLAIERNNVGDGIVDHLYYSDVRDRMYFDKDRDLVQHNMAEHETTESMLKKQAKIKTFYGVWTGPQSRDDMMTILTRHVAEYKDKFVTKNITRDIGSLIRKASGKIEAAPGFHDDSVMSYLIALYVYYHGNNLPLFGIFRQDTNVLPENTGIRKPEEINPSLVDPTLINAAIKREKINKQPNWDEMMQKTILESQQRSYQLQKRGLIQTDQYNNVPGDAMMPYEDTGEMDLSFFNDLNGF